MKKTGYCLFCNTSPCECDTQQKKKLTVRPVTRSKRKPDFTRSPAPVPDLEILMAIRCLHEGGAISYAELRRGESDLGG